MESTKVSLLDVNALNESLKLIVGNLNKGVHNGGYNMDEVFMLKIACNNIETCINSLDKLQTYYVNMVTEQNNTKIEAIEKDN